MRDAACHCGRPVHVYDEPGMEGFTRGLCLECSTVRCDVEPGVCGRYGSLAGWLADLPERQAAKAARGGVRPDDLDELRKERVVQPEREQEQNRRSGPTYSTDRRCGHAIRTDRYDDTLSACQLAEGHDGDHTDYCHVWRIQSWGASQQPAHNEVPR